MRRHRGSVKDNAAAKTSWGRVCGDSGGIQPRTDRARRSLAVWGSAARQSARQRSTDSMEEEEGVAADEPVQLLLVARASSVTGPATRDASGTAFRLAVVVTSKSRSRNQRLCPMATQVSQTCSNSLSKFAVSAQVTPKHGEQGEYRDRLQLALPSSTEHLLQERGTQRILLPLSEARLGQRSCQARSGGQAQVSLVNLLRWIRGTPAAPAHLQVLNFGGEGVHHELVQLQDSLGSPQSNERLELGPRPPRVRHSFDTDHGLWILEQLPVLSLRAAGLVHGSRETTGKASRANAEVTQEGGQGQSTAAAVFTVPRSA